MLAYRKTQQSSILNESGISEKMFIFSLFIFVFNVFILQIEFFKSCSFYFF